MFNWLFRNKEEVPKPTWEEEPVINVTPREYTDKGVSYNGNRWRAHVYIARGTVKDSYNIYLGSFKTKEEAQEVRWNFIEKLK